MPENVISNANETSADSKKPPFSSQLVNILSRSSVLELSSQELLS